MGYRGEVVEKERARALRREGFTMPEARPSPAAPGPAGGDRGSGQIRHRPSRAAQTTRSSSPLGLRSTRVKVPRRRVRSTSPNSMSAACGSPSTSTKGWTSTRRSLLVRCDRCARERSGKADRAVPVEGIRHNTHVDGCVYVRYSCTRTHRAIMGLVRALLSSAAVPGW